MTRSCPTGAAGLDEPDAAADLRTARASLLPAELARYRALCREVAEVLTDAATGARPADAERDVAARLAADLVARGIDPLVTLVAGRSRLAHRHPLPTAAPLGDRAMLVVCGRRHGLIANATRWVRWGASAIEADAARRILDVEAAFLAGTWVGATVGEAFAAGIAAYGRSGFDPGEWRRHHQGGAAGYAGRDPRGTPAVTDPVQARPGVRVEPDRAGRQGRGHRAGAARRHRGADYRPALADDARDGARSPDRARPCRLGIALSGNAIPPRAAQRNPQVDDDTEEIR